MFTPTKQFFSEECSKLKLDANEAPEGYCAILKSVAQEPGQSVNFCQLCDYRNTCQQQVCKPPCRPDTRKDQQSVVFKKQKKAEN